MSTHYACSVIIKLSNRAFSQPRHVKQSCSSCSCSCVFCATIVLWKRFPQEQNQGAVIMIIKHVKQFTHLSAISSNFFTQLNLTYLLIQFQKSSLLYSDSLPTEPGSGSRHTHRKEGTSSGKERQKPFTGHLSENMSLFRGLTWKSFTP